MYKKLLVTFFLFVFILFTFIGVIVIVIDPFQYYRKASFYLPVFNKSDYLTPGLVKNYDFDSIILGSSMVENFKLSDVSNIEGFRKPIKFSLPGAHAKNMKIFADLAFNEKNITSVLIGLDIFALEGGPDSLVNGQDSLPEYLYDDNFLNDYKYIFNIDTLAECIRPFAYMKMKGPNANVFNYNIMFHNNISDAYFDVSVPMNSYNSRVYTPAIDTNKTNELIQSFKQNIMPMIQENSDTKFVIFYPPYAILTFKHQDREGNFKSYNKAKLEINSLLIRYKNVQVFDFQVAKDITHNLHHYRDFSHYSYEINTLITEMIREGSYLVTKDTVDKNYKLLEQQKNDYIIKN